jgi:glucose/arabinose dehydrogenase
VTAPFQPFGVSNQTRIPAARNGKPSGAIYSISPEGGDLKVEAWGVRNPRGLTAEPEGGRIYFTDDGMDLRGTRPVKDDPDVVFRLLPQAFYGWPDFSRTLEPISSAKYQPPPELAAPSGYSELSELINSTAEMRVTPNLVVAPLPALSGAAKLDVVPSSGPFREFHDTLIVALWGDRAPFATSGRKMIGPTGYKLVRVDPFNHRVEDFVFNPKGGPASTLHPGVGLERPVDVKFGPDGALYILDFGELQMKSGKEKIGPGTGKVFRLVPNDAAHGAPATGAARP